MTAVPPIVYEQVLDASGKLLGWNVPEAERRDWEQRKQRLSDHPWGVSAKPAPKGTRALADLLTELREALELDNGNEEGFRALYSRNPNQATKLAARVVTETQAGRLDRPEGFLAWRLRELEK